MQKAMRILFLIGAIFPGIIVGYLCFIELVNEIETYQESHGDAEPIPLLSDGYGICIVIAIIIVIVILLKILYCRFR